MEVLEQVAAMPITTWKFKEDDSAVRHIGPMAQDFHQAFGLGLDDRHISTTDADGVALAAIQALKQLLDDKDRKIQDLEDRLQKLEQPNQENPWEANQPIPRSHPMGVPDTRPKNGGP